ncbi:hypothetical protein [Hyphomonas sp.]|uniref:hypothetical protein n=1 Tax=Hyphomonas sp. TaxID=87 RepID=UPI00391D68FE
MQFKAILKGAIVAGVMAVMGAGSALAQQACTETQFGARTGAIYLEAETAAMTNKDFNTAAARLQTLQTMELNCYERIAIVRLGAYVKLERGDRRGAVQDLLSLINMGAIPQDQMASTYYNIAQIYLQEEDLRQALEYMTRWQRAGGRPDRTQKWQLAVLNQRADNYAEAVRWAEEVRREDGSRFDQQLYDLLLFLYDRTNNNAKVAEILEVLVERNPQERRYWDAIAGNLFQANQEQRAFEVQKAMYLAGLLRTEEEIMRIVNFYNRLDAPYHAARILEKEMNAGRIQKTVERLDLLANLYQVAREHEKAIPVIRQAAEMGGGGAMYERLGASYNELGRWAETEEALTRALNTPGIRDRAAAWVRIGQSRYERNDRSGAREAFRQANNPAGRGWLAFMDSEEYTAAALVCFEVQSALSNVQNEQKICQRLSVVGDENLPEGCRTVRERLTELEQRFRDTPECRRVSAQPV